MIENESKGTAREERRSDGYQRSTGKLTPISTESATSFDGRRTYSFGVRRRIAKTGTAAAGGTLSESTGTVCSTKDARSGRETSRGSVGLSSVPTSEELSVAAVPERGTVQR